MTRIQQYHTDDDPYPERVGFKNFTWTPEALGDWEEVWYALWHIGIKWEWQNSDRYARPYGDEFNLFAVHNDAYRLDMAVPLPAYNVVLNIHEHLLDLPTDDSKVDEATNRLRAWIKKYA